MTALQIKSNDMIQLATGQWLPAWQVQGGRFIGNTEESYPKHQKPKVKKVFVQTKY